MATNTTPIFPLTPATVTCSIAAANTANDGSGAVVDAITGGTFGTIVYQVNAVSAQTSLAAFGTKVVTLFLTDSSGSNPRHLGDISMTGATPSTTVAAVTYSWYPPNGQLRLVSGQKIQVKQTIYAGAQDLTHVVTFADNY